MNLQRQIWLTHKGKHEEIQGTSRRSKALFAVNHVYHASIIRSPEYTMSHELEFCPDRWNEYLHAGVLSCASEVVNPFAGVLSCASDVVKSVAGVQSCATEVVNLAAGVLSCASDVINPAVGVLSSASDVVKTAVGVLSSASSALNRASDILRHVTGDVANVCFGTKAALLSGERLLFDSESLETFVEPKCGGCLCTMCPVPWLKYSFTVLVGFRNGVYFVEKDVHMQRFLWRELELENEPNCKLQAANCKMHRNFNITQVC